MIWFTSALITLAVKIIGVEGPALGIHTNGVCVAMSC